LGSGEFTVDIAVNAPDSEVFIALYDLTGHRVEILHDGVFPMGNFTISHQNNLPAGVYYVRATIGGKTFAAPLTVVR
jgi:hypothetical protein